MDRLFVRGLRAKCVIGAREEERGRPQDVLISVVLFLDLRPAGRSDRLSDSVDYSALQKAILARVEESRFSLVEALAEAVAEICLREPGIQQARVRVEKPGAWRMARRVGVEIRRRRAG